ncbi:MAG: phosphoglycerate kinase [Candidatus Paceibacterota bacterium]|jgi:phosphoglycerate kinase|nr:phosphoglycerate kinase [Candidatus Paceibacterota bacterium]MDD4831056.1 phosphoglycerate kinase [Candidatus Paceibacterota bacterium]MDD4875314.1 phosphoglycerate kinase [Candidatus Paceibacterota bacterium]
MRTIQQIDVRDQKVLVRCDFNVPLDKNGNISDNFRILKTLPTINYLIEKNAKIILISHLGSPKGKDLKYSLRPVARELSRLLGREVLFLKDCIGSEVEKSVGKLEKRQVALLENLRFYNEEKANDPVFAQKLAKLADVFVQDGFAVCHRSHASTVGIPNLLPSAAGMLLEKEFKILSKALEDPYRPLVAIVGGAKISTKIKVIKKFLEKADHLLVGGKIANTILAVKGICVRDPLPQEAEEVLKDVEAINLTDSKLHLPVDGIMSLADLNEKYLRSGAVGTVRREEEIFDVGPETINNFKNVISSAEMVIWNGPLGYSEISPFEKSSLEIAKAIKKSGAFSIIGGGETVEFVTKIGMIEDFNHVSTGGGAMLDFLSGDALPGIEILKKEL